MESATKFVSVIPKDTTVTLSNPRLSPEYASSYFMDPRSGEKQSFEETKLSPAHAYLSQVRAKCGTL